MIKGARSAPGPRLAADLGKRRTQDALTGARHSFRVTGRAFRETVARLGAAYRS